MSNKDMSDVDSVQGVSRMPNVTQVFSVVILLYSLSVVVLKCAEVYRAIAI